jgi:hypothetical protein
LLAGFNVFVWDVTSLPHQTKFGILLYKGLGSNGEAYFTSIVPGIRTHGPGIAWALSILVGVVLPLVFFLIWQRRQKRPDIGWAGAAGVPKLSLGPPFLILLPLLVVLNILAWDWVKFPSDSDLGITPGINLGTTSGSVIASFFVGEILPLVLAAALFRRRQPPALPLAPVTGAPR